MRYDPTADTFGLPPSLWIPIAARSPEAVARYVGQVVATRTGRDGRLNALLVDSFRDFVRDESVPLWSDPDAAWFESRLYPLRQVWVHVDYSGYRRSYLGFGMEPPPDGFFLDHIQNRKAIRLRGYTHPYLRLCPVAASVNTSGGVASGGEGMERAYVEEMLASEDTGRELRARLQTEIVYADPMDITKMLNREPGVATLPGVAEVMALLYP